MAGTARQSQLQVVHFLRKRFNYNDTTVANGAYVGTLPGGAIILSMAAEVTVATAFNGGTTNPINVGTTPLGNNIGAGINGGATGATRLAAADALGPMAADTDIWVNFIPTGTAPTAGIGYVLIPYIPNIDL